MAAILETMLSGEGLMGPTLVVIALQPNVLGFVSFQRLSFPKSTPGHRPEDFHAPGVYHLHS